MAARPAPTPILPKAKRVQCPPTLLPIPASSMVHAPGAPPPVPIPPKAKRVKREDLEHTAALLPVSSSDEMPADLVQHLQELEAWASANSADALRDTWAFWALKLPAIFASASAGVLAHFNLITVSVVAGAIASVCVIVDGLHPRGILRNMHLRAYHDIRLLTTHIVAGWRSRGARSKPESVARRLIQSTENERQRIATYIRNAETALNTNAEDAANDSSGRGEIKRAGTLPLSSNFSL
jgi:hypothetical protein